MRDPDRPETEEAPQHAGIKGLIRDLLSINRGALAILVTVPFVLTLLDYYGMPWQYPEYRAKRPSIQGKEMRRTPPPLADKLDEIKLPGSPQLRKWLWWGICCAVFLVLIPMLVAWLFAKRSPRDLGLRIKGTGRDAWTYLVLFAIFFPVIWLVSQTEAFQRTYPFYDVSQGGLSTEFLLFELIYCSQFFAIEFFFRGFMVLGLKRVLGWASVLVMLAPYCMIHYYKPMPEALGAIGAGLVLGTLSWRTGTILYGWALHYGVALSMDLLALHYRDLL